MLFYLERTYTADSAKLNYIYRCPRVVLNLKDLKVQLETLRLHGLLKIICQESPTFVQQTLMNVMHIITE